MSGSIAPFVAAERRLAQSVGVPGTLIVDGKRCDARLYTERGSYFLMEGGSQQTRKLSAVILATALPAAQIIDSSGNTRSVPVTHLETGLAYRINTGGVNRSPYGVFWTLECSQETAQ